MAIPENLQGDYDKYWSDTEKYPKGYEHPWAGGTITKGNYGAIYKDPSGSSVLLKPESDINELALGNQNIANSWGSSYGFSPEAPEKKESAYGLLVGSTYTPPNTGNTSVEYDAPNLGPADDSHLASTQLEGLLESNSPYLTAARSRAQQAANSRGLVNTTMAGTAGEKAAIEAAFPIAESDATFLQGLTAQEREGILAGALQKQQGDITQKGYETQGAISGQLNIQEGAIAASKAAYQSALDSGLSEQEAKQASDLAGQEFVRAKELESIQQEGANYRQNIEIAANEVIEGLKLTTEEKRQVSVAVGAAGEKFLELFNDIQRDPNVDDKDTAIISLMAAYQIELDTIMGLYGEEADIDLGDYPPPWENKDEDGNKGDDE